MREHHIVCDDGTGDHLVGGTEIDAALVSALVADQFPRWADLPVAPVPRQGWDNRTFRIGDELSVRLPSGPGYVDAVAKEDAVLPFLAEHLALPVPAPVAAGRPGCGYPYPWSVRRWLPGDTLADSPGAEVATELGRFLTALRAVPAEHGPVAGRHCFFRGCHPGVYGGEVDEALHALGHRVDVRRCRRIWHAATASAWAHEPVWFHGDVAPGNVVVTGGRLAAMIDFGTCGVGDPACDLVMAWTYFSGPERGEFRRAAGLDDDTWRRARGWALWKALVTLAGRSGPDVDGQRRALRAVLDDPVT